MLKWASYLRERLCAVFPQTDKQRVVPLLASCSLAIKCMLLSYYCLFEPIILRFKRGSFVRHF
jgi:hypothetical protein